MTMSCGRTGTSAHAGWPLLLVRWLYGMAETNFDPGRSCWCESWCWRGAVPSGLDLGNLPLAKFPVLANKFPVFRPETRFDPGLGGDLGTLFRPDLRSQRRAIGKLLPGLLRDLSVRKIPSGLPLPRCRRKHRPLRMHRPPRGADRSR
jgi:hypothetical protein